MKRPSARQRSKRGFALLTVLGAIVVLSAVALAMSFSVRTEISAATNRTDDLRAYYLARAGVQEALYLLTYAQNADVPTLRRLRAQVGSDPLRFELAEGRARVEIRSEAGKMDINQADEDLLADLLRMLGVEANRARTLAQAIVQWRTSRQEGVEDALDGYYRSLREPYRARHAPFATVEELLLVRGMSRDILYGSFEVDEEGKVTRRGGLADFVTVYNRTGLIDANSARYEVLRALGVSDFGARSIVAARAARPFATLADLQVAALAEASTVRLGLGAGDTLEIIATGEPKDSAVRHTVRAIVKRDAQVPSRYRILAWYDQSPQWNR